MLNKAKVGVGVATLGMALGLVPAVAASGSVKATAPVRLSALCTTYKNDIKKAGKAESPAITKAIESTNWSKAQKALLTAFNGQVGAQKNLLTALGKSSAAVKNAANVAIKFDNTIKNLIIKSKSKAQYQSAVTAASKSPKLAAAENVLDSYTQKTCPGLLGTPSG